MMTGYGGWPTPRAARDARKSRRLWLTWRWACLFVLVAVVDTVWVYRVEIDLGAVMAAWIAVVWF
jgi:hypothetical protein